MEEVRAYCYIDALQPQCAALLSALVEGSPVAPGSAALLLEVAPGTEIYHLADVGVKASSVSLAHQEVERRFGTAVVHAPSPNDVLQASTAMLREARASVHDISPPKIHSCQHIHRVSPDQAQLMNRSKSGQMLLPGESLCVVELEAAAYAVLAANLAEKAGAISLVDIWCFGLFGRLFFGGREAAVQAALEGIEEGLASHPGL